MWRPIALICLPLLLVASPALAVTAKEKMETCKVGAEAQNLQGAQANAFIKKCMAGGNYQPQARKDALKTSKKPAPKPAAAAPQPAQQKQQ
jgi:hypothetical protein